MIGLIILFFALLFVASLLLNLVFKVLPFGKSINSIGGVVFGVVRGVLLVLVMGAIIHSLALSGNWIAAEDIEKTWILKFINEINPILYLFD